MRLGGGRFRDAQTITPTEFKIVTEVSHSSPDGSSNSHVVELHNVGVRYRIPNEQLSGMKEFAIRWLQRKISYNDFWAVRNVSLEVGRGETFGIIGRNGAGKSTLLKVVAHVLKPMEGRAIVRGRVAPLLELGAGFHPELTGRENVFMNGTLLGRSQAQMREQFQSILEFSELEEFIDAPIRTYSTGMVARLGFAVATAEVPDVLIVDEILSVGDAPFQRKCLERLEKFREEGTTILLVAHGMDTIRRMCGRAVWLESGEMRLIGSAEKVSGEYLHYYSASGGQATVDL